MRIEPTTDHHGLEVRCLFTCADLLYHASFRLRDPYKRYDLLELFLNGAELLLNSVKSGRPIITEA